MIKMPGELWPYSDSEYSKLLEFTEPFKCEFDLVTNIISLNQAPRQVP